MKPKVSIIITSKNSESTLDALLRSIKNQTYKNIEIIFVDNNSIDKTKAIAKKYTSKVFNYGPERSAQRNFGATKAKGQYLFILDTDMILGKKVVAECISAIDADKKIGAIIVPEKSFGIGVWAKAKILEREINEGEKYFEAARFFPKDIFLKFKGYDETLTGPEDWDLPKRISKKYQIGRTKEYILHDEGELEIKTLIKKKYYYGLSAHKYLKKQKVSTFSAQTIYFLRPAFYKQWRKLLREPVISIVMILMLFLELSAGGIGFIQGQTKSEKP